MAMQVSMAIALHLSVFHFMLALCEFTALYRLYKHTVHILTYLDNSSCEPGLLSV